MSGPRPEDHQATIEREASAFATAARLGLDQHVPTCPKFDVADLTVHLGAVHRWAAEMVATAATDRIGGMRENFATEASRPDLVDWFTDGAAHLLDVLRSTDPAQPMWTLGGPGVAGFWSRRQAHETAVHRWDVENATGTALAIDPDQARDGIAERLETFAPMQRRLSPRAGEGESFHFHCTDRDGEWVLRFAGAGVEVTTEHAKSDVAVRGAASDLLLFLWNRVGPEAVDIVGDTDRLAAWPELMPAI